MKIAVCLSGQPRSIEKSIESIKNYFNSKNYTVDFFCHVWNYNTWKTKTENKILFGDYEPVDKDWLESQIQKFSPKYFRIGDNQDIPDNEKHIVWGSLFYSMYYANMLKIKYEIENNFRYDYVVKSRYDVVFSPEKKFIVEPVVKERHLYFNHKDRMKARYNLINASDPIFYGDSWGMDIISDCYLYIVREFNKPFTRRLDQVGGHDPGTYISTFAHKNNIIVDSDRYNPCDVIFRKEAMHLNVISDFKEIEKIHHSYYA